MRRLLGFLARSAFLNDIIHDTRAYGVSAIWVNLRYAFNRRRLHR